MHTIMNEATQPNLAPMRVAGYIRAEATSEVEQEWSFDWQRDMIEQFCSDDQHEIVGIYADIGDEGQKVNPVERTEFLEMISDGEAIDLIVVASVDRISSSLSTALRTMEELDRANLVVRLVSENIYSSDPGVTFQLALSKGVSQLLSSGHSARVDRRSQLHRELAS